MRYGRVRVDQHKITSGCLSFTHVPWRPFAVDQKAEVRGTLMLSSGRKEPKGLRSLGAPVVLLLLEDVEVESHEWPLGAVRQCCYHPC